MPGLGFWVLAVPGTIVLVGVGVLLFVMKTHNVAEDLSGESLVSRPENKSDHPVPHDASEEDASDPGAAALMWSPDATSAGLEVYN